MATKRAPILNLLNNYGKNGTNTKIRGDDVGCLIKNYKSILDLIHQTNTPAILEPSALNGERKPLTHQRLREFITNEFDLNQFGLTDGERVSILVPNGPEVAVVIVAVLNKYCAAPINPTNTWQEIKSELVSTQAQTIIILAGASANEAAIQAADSLNIGVLVITPLDDITGLFRISILRSVPKNKPKINRIANTVEGFHAFEHPETVLLLHTSGTSGNKKLVPYSLDMIIIGVGCIISSWNLTEKDVCLNMMPLFHIGGIMRNIFSPILSGGCVIACSGFDPLLFWDIMYSGQRVTWYYAAPTMHHALLQESAQRPKPLPVANMRFIANAAGGLLPVLAQGLRDTFHATILTSYGMTECMPISSPPQTYALDPTGTSGIPVGPEVIIVDDSMSVRVQAGVKGNIFVRGAPCFGGYENNGSANEESFFTVDGIPGWFNTGDMGHLDSNNYLFISGRSKEIINRGGETISPFEIEEAVIQHPFIKETLAFSAPHSEYQETVGAVIVTQLGQPRVDLPHLHTYLEDKLHRSKWPQILIYMDNLPKNAAGKILRIRMSERLQLKDIDEESSPSTRLYEAKCPVLGAPLTELITKTAVTIDTSVTEILLLSTGKVKSAVVVTVDLPFRPSSLVAFVTPLSTTVTMTPSHSNNNSKPTTRQNSANTIDVTVTESDDGNDDNGAEALSASLLAICEAKQHQYLQPVYIHVISQEDFKRASENGSSYSSSSASSSSSSLSSINNNNSNDYSLSRPNNSDDKSIINDNNHTNYSNDTDDNNLRITPAMIAGLKALALKLFNEKDTIGPRSDMEFRVEEIWREFLRASVGTTISVTQSFFALGGDSLKAGQLVAAMRKRLGVQLSVADLLSAPTIEGVAHKIISLKTLGSPRLRPTPKVDKAKLSPYRRGRERERHLKQSGSYQQVDSNDPEATGTHNNDDDDDEEYDKYASSEYASPFSNTSFACLFIQALPLVVVYPIRRIIIWFLIAGPWVELMKLGFGRFISLIMAMLIMRVALAIFAPLAGIVVKWILIGRYQAGRYPLWGSMYLRWWFVERVINVFGKGVFRDDIPVLGPHLVRLYYVMMGASIGRNVKIHRDARLGQADLLTIGDDVCIDNAIVRPFSIEEGYFVLLPIKIGSRCSIGVKSAIVAGTTLPSGTCLGPLSSSYEAAEAESHYRDYCRTAFLSPPVWMIVFLGLPILLAVVALSRIPWYIGLMLMVSDAKFNGWYDSDVHSILHAFLWWITPQRLAYYFLLRAIRRCLVPYVHLGFAILIKWCIIGKFTPMNEEQKQQPWNCFRYWLMARLLPGGSLGGVAKLVGTHYEIISMIYRALGAQIGKRVYWPGSGLEIIEYDLLDVGDDVVFGSRSVVLTSSAKRSAKVVFESGSMVADRCVILPGVYLHRGAVLGSGSLTVENMDIPIGSVWVGSRDGCAVMAAPSDSSYGSNDTITPFGRAFYQHKAPYFVIPLWMIVLYNTLWQAFCTCYRNSPTALSLLLCRVIMQFDRIEYHPLEIFKYTVMAFVPLHVTLCLFALGFDVAAKWALLGQRKQGAYAWDQSSYCQRWQVYLTLQEIRRSERRSTGILDMIEGSQYLVWYFRALGSSIGENVCLYPNGGDPMMTEPDLVTIGEGASIDDASLIAHINTRGTFRLNPLVVGAGCVCKSATRLLSGAAMENHSIMLEHTLVLAGETVDSGRVWQGWPSHSQISLDDHRDKMWKKLSEAHKERDRMKKRERSYSINSMSALTTNANNNNNNSSSKINVTIAGTGTGGSTGVSAGRRSIANSKIKNSNNSNHPSPISPLHNSQDKNKSNNSKNNSYNNNSTININSKIRVIPYNIRNSSDKSNNKSKSLEMTTSAVTDRFHNNNGMYTNINASQNSNNSGNNNKNTNNKNTTNTTTTNQDDNRSTFLLPPNISLLAPFPLTTDTATTTTGNNSNSDNSSDASSTERQPLFAVGQAKNTSSTSRTSPSTSKYGSGVSGSSV